MPGRWSGCWRGCGLEWGLQDLMFCFFSIKKVKRFVIRFVLEVTDYIEKGLLVRGGLDETVVYQAKGI
jgi:hypothetical protein